MVPASLTARESGASFSKDKCVLISLCNTTTERPRDRGVRASLSVASLAGCQSAFKFDPAYCRIRECYPDGAIGVDDPTSTDRLSFGAFEARATGGAVGGSGPS